MWGVMNTHAHITSLVPHFVFHITSHLRVNTFPFSSESIHADSDLDGPLPSFTPHAKLFCITLLGLILISNLSGQIPTFHVFEKQSVGKAIHLVY